MRILVDFLTLIWTGLVVLVAMSACLLIVALLIRWLRV